MKRALSYLLLFAYSTNILMPVLPHVSDALAHTFWLYQHIATVHYEDGEYHTHYQSIEVSKKTNSEKNTTTPTSTTTNEHIVATINYHFQLPVSDLPLFGDYSFSPTSIYFLSDYPPPKA